MDEPCLGQFYPGGQKHPLPNFLFLVKQIETNYKYSGCGGTTRVQNVQINPGNKLINNQKQRIFIENAPTEKI